MNRLNLTFPRWLPSLSKGQSSAFAAKAAQLGFLVTIMSETVLSELVLDFHRQRFLPGNISWFSNSQ
jgi:hypothetical protein